MKSRKKKFKEEFKQELELEDEKIILEELKEMGNDDTIYDITFDHRPSQAKKRSTQHKEINEALDKANIVFQNEDIADSSRNQINSSRQDHSFRSLL